MDIHGVMSVRQMIDAALGQIDANRVNFKLVQMILHILAQQQNILTRFVQLKSVQDAPAGGMIKVTEITAKPSTKTQAKQKSKKEEELKTTLSKYEENNEHLLKVINQVADSKAEIDPNPPPMESAVISEAMLSTHGFLVETFHKFTPSSYPGTVIDREGGRMGEGAIPTSQLQWIIDAIKEIQGKLHITPKTAPSTTTNALSKTTTVPSEFDTGDAVFATKDKNVSDLEHRMAQVENEIYQLKQKGDSNTQAQLMATTYDTVNNLKENFEKQKELLANSMQDFETQLMHLSSKTGTKMAMMEILIENLKSVPERMEKTESSMRTFTQQMNSFDAGISTQITALHEQISEAKNELEELSNTVNNAGASTDAAVLAEMNLRLITLANDVDIINVNQKQFFDEQTKAANNQLALIDQLENMKTTKADKDEVEDALRDKAEMKHLNGLVPLTYFEAVRLDSEKRIDQNASRLAMQEMIWQKAMEELQNSINTKSSLMELDALGYHTDEHLRVIKEQIQCIQEILGEPQAAMAKRQLLKDYECASCGTKAPPSMPGPTIQESISLKPTFPAKKQPYPDYMLLKETPPIPTGPEPYPDELICYKGQPRPKTRTDMRSHLCQRYCGGSHTIIGPNIKRTVPELKVTELPTRLYQGVGSDGKTYQMVETVKLEPCVPCNIRKQPPLPPKQNESSCTCLSNVAAGDSVESTHPSKTTTTEYRRTSQGIQSIVLSVTAEPTGSIKQAPSGNAIAHKLISVSPKAVSERSVRTSQADAISLTSARHITIAEKIEVNTGSQHRQSVNEGTKPPALDGATD